MSKLWNISKVVSFRINMFWVPLHKSVDGELKCEKSSEIWFRAIYSHPLPHFNKWPRRRRKAEIILLCKSIEMGNFVLINNVCVSERETCFDIFIPLVPSLLLCIFWAIVHCQEEENNSISMDRKNAKDPYRYLLICIPVFYETWHGSSTWTSY